MKEGESNSQFFHSSLQEKRKRLSITRIKDSNGEWVDDLKDIEKEGVAFFWNLLTNDHQCDGGSSAAHQLIQHIPCRVTTQQNEALIGEVSLDEVKAAVFGLDGDSAAGADGF